MRYLTVGIAGAVLGAVLTAAVFVVFVDREGPGLDPNEPVLVYVAREHIPKGTRLVDPDLYFVTTVPRKDKQERRFPSSRR